ncbi:nitroreductase family protein [Acidithiobacillus thiooxidans]|jgi:nitroreductase|nr:nitroreductase family protein [Acidithiobacillus thiooxidans]
MLDFRPALQLVFRDQKPVLYDLLNSRFFEINDLNIVPIIATLTDLVPGHFVDLSTRLSDAAEIEPEEARVVIEELVSMGLLCSIDSIVSQKVGVQKWVDNGWIDALILHFASRNLSYVDDPMEFGGRNDTSCCPLNSGQSIKRQNDVMSTVGRIPLWRPQKEFDGSSLMAAMLSRRSFNQFHRKAFRPNELDLILWYANLYARDRSAVEFNDDDRDHAYDSAFSCLYSYVVLYEPVEVGSICLKPGAYLYDVKAHALALVRDGVLRSEISRIAIGQKRAGSGMMSIIICADWEGYGRVYAHERAYRNLLINTAQLAQFYLVLATSQEFDTFMTPAIQDESMAELLGIQGACPLYLITAG